MTAAQRGLYALLTAPSSRWPFQTSYEGAHGRCLLRWPATSTLVDSEYPFRPLGEHELWAADVSVTKASRAQMSEAEGEYVLGWPEIVVEVLSPSNTEAEMQDRRETCFHGGRREFWQVDLDLRTINVHQPEGTLERYAEPDAMPFVLTGLTVPVSSLLV